MDDSILEKVDPWKLYNFSANYNFSYQELRDKFRQLALITHPDKPTGSIRKFQIVKVCYK